MSQPESAQLNIYNFWFKKSSRINKKYKNSLHPENWKGYFFKKQVLRVTAKWWGMPEEGPRVCKVIGGTLFDWDIVNF